MNKQLKVIDQFTRRIDNDVHTYVIETYWILEDLSVILDSQEHPARWIYDRQEVRSKPVNLSDCPSEVKRLGTCAQIRYLSGRDNSNIPLR